eukprot:2387004-Rhodomonas_salina.1
MLPRQWYRRPASSSPPCLLRLGNASSSPPCFLGISPAPSSSLLVRPFGVAAPPHPLVYASSASLPRLVLYSMPPRPRRPASLCPLRLFGIA